MRLIPFVIPIFLCACSTFFYKPVGAPAFDEEVEINFLAEEDEVKAGSIEVINVTCYFSLIPGHLYGNSTTKAIREFTVKNSEKMKLGFSEKSFKFPSTPSTYKPSSENKQQLKITPNDLKFARIATYCKREKPGYYTGFGDKYSGTPYFVVFSDRPGRILGKYEMKDGVIDIDIKFDQPGFHVVTDQKTKEKEFSVRNASDDRTMVLYFAKTAERLEKQFSP